MPTVARPSMINLSAALGLLVLAASSAMPAHAADERVAALSRPCATATASALCASEVARAHAATPAAAKPAATVKPAAAQPAAKPSRHGNYERDLWRHQGVG